MIFETSKRLFEGKKRESLPGCAGCDNGNATASLVIFGFVSCPPALAHPIFGFPMEAVRGSIT